MYTIANKKICVVGLGYVGLSTALLLTQSTLVYGIDKNPDIVNKLANGKSHIKDNLIPQYLSNNNNFHVTTDLQIGVDNADYIILAVPTNFNVSIKKFDLDIIEDILSEIRMLNTDALIIIKSTLGIGDTEYLRKVYKDLKLIYSPEFLREGKSMYDVLNPDRIIYGGDYKDLYEFSQIVCNCITKQDTPVLFVDTKEAEAIKLFSNAYLAMRIAFFNELDGFAESNNLNTRKIIEGLGYDKRIGNYYNNPSFGYGGYCLPKDTIQLIENISNTPNKLISSIHISNIERKKYVIQNILKYKVDKIGIYKLSMKCDSDNFRNSAIIDIAKGLKENNKKIIIFDSNIKEKEIFGIEVTDNFNEFTSKVDLIVTNRSDQEIDNIKNKIYTRDIFHTG